MPSGQMAILAAVITATLWCMVAALWAARKGWTFHALIYLAIAGVPFAVIAVRADAERAAKQSESGEVKAGLAADETRLP